MRPRRHFLAGLIVAMVSLVLTAPAALGRPRPETTATFDGERIRIKTFIEIHGPQATPALATVIEAEINRVWQDPANQHTYCGLPVEFEAEVRMRQGSGSGGWHQIKIRQLRRGQVFRDYVDSLEVFGWDVGGEWSPYNDLVADRYGRTVYAHEAGHLFGAPDEYIEGWAGSRDVPGRESTLMNDNVPWIDAYTVNNILQNAFPEGDESLPGCLQGTTYHEVTIQENGHERTGFLSLDVSLSPLASGELRGNGVGEFTLAGTVEQGGCGFTYSTAAPINLDLVASGSGRGPYTIESQLPIFIEEVQRHALCAEPVDLQIEWKASLTLDDVVFGPFDPGNGARLDRQYVLDETTPDGKVRVHLWLNGVDGP